jgi:xanthine/uracil/vitamin C permease (AzgA family)
MTERWEQPEPARPAAARTFSQMSDAERAELLSAQDKANTATPGLQTALTLLPAVAALAALVAVGIFMASHFRAMDLQYAVDAQGNRIGGQFDYHAVYIAFAAVVGAVVALAGARIDVTARTRTLMMTIGVGVMIVVGSCVGLLIGPSSKGLQVHYHVGVWGTRASFYRLFDTFDALGWLVAACGLAVLVLMVLQRRRIDATYPK